MQLNTKHFGIIEINEKNILNFPDGIPGFEKVRKFVLLSNPDGESPFQWLQCIDDSDLAFVVIEPLYFKPDYDIDIDDSEVQILDIKNISNVLLLTIVVVPDDITKMTANLKAPIIINTENNKGRQIILEKGDYKTKHYIMEELQKIGRIDASTY